ncbi:MarR family winged helix-turn-helix transcriptional regulator [Enemella evansiae]|nr:MarR family winged helix-turn-helix transcriptional regulator [Enemella evansiae]TDO93014.1 DNA-binding MarR family transcriptional regulator [Enemella evansiae]
MSSPTDLGYRLLRLVGRLNRYASHHTDFVVPPAQMRLLALVQDMEPARVGVLAAADHSSQPTMTSQLNRTERAGWTQRSPDPADARAQVVRLTDAGRRELDDIRARRAEALAPALAEWPEERRRRLADAVALLEELMGELSNEEQPTTDESNDRRES